MTKILIVDDDAFMRRLLHQVLHQSGYEVIIATNGQEGINKIASENPDLVVMDQHMPNMNGDEALRILRADPNTRALPILIASATLESNDVEKLERAGATGFIPKPFQVKQLLPTIQQQLAHDT
ncbi:MAG: response regulator [Chloroflexota bacterium]|nr:response regulator [Chloroflexota bacterium]